VPLFGGNGFNFGAFSGMRLTLGGWLDRERMWGVEGSAFFLQQRSVRFSTASDANGNPPIYVPRFATDLGQEGSFTISDPVAGFTGNLSISSTTRLWGTEANGVVNLWSTRRFEVDGIFGFRYLNLDESLNIDAPNLGIVGFDINDSIHEQFRTQNHFYGGQIGARLRVENGPLSFVGAAKLALGVSHQIVDIQGSTTETGTASNNPGTFPGGIFTQSSNIGQRNANQFTVIPEIQMQVGYQFRPWLKFFVSYDFLYWNQVVRPGSEIDRNVNATQSLFQGGALVGTARPSPIFDRTDFWAQAVRFGVELKF
jgi:hypothetical protein